MTTPISSQLSVSLQQLSEVNNSRSLLQLIMRIKALEGGCHMTAADIINRPFGQLRLDSRQVATGDVFILLNSQTPNPQKSRDYLHQAAKKAVFILSESNPLALFDAASLATLSCPILYVPAIRDVLGELVQARLQYQQSVPLPVVVAVTGTNGKTTISQLVAQLAQLSGISSAIMGTAGNGKLGALTQATHTTGDALAVQQFLYQMGEEGVALLALEASSHGLDQQRLQGVPVTVAIYTNLSRDHLDYHADMDEYVAAKARLFDSAYFPTLTHAIINSDDEYAHVMLDTAHASGLTVWTYSLNAEANATFTASDMAPSLAGVKMTLRSEFGDSDIVSPLLGRFNVANLLAAIGAAVALGMTVSHIATVVPALQGAVGRMQRVPSHESCYIVDYAHTPDALAQVLASLRAHCEGKLWAVFGCGGDRDTGKRPLMAQAGLAGADKVVLTADNPRTEDPIAILQDMQVGMTAEHYQRTHIEPSRQKAIAYAVSHANPDDIVVIAGKGHETYQEIDGVRYDFDDRVVLAQALQYALMGQASK